MLVEFIVDPDPIEAAPICPDYDSDCKDVVDVFYCWTGAWGPGCAEGHCPMLINRSL